MTLSTEQKIISTIDGNYNRIYSKALQKAVKDLFMSGNTVAPGDGTLGSLDDIMLTEETKIVAQNDEEMGVIDYGAIKEDILKNVEIPDIPIIPEIPVDVLKKSDVINASEPGTTEGAKAVAILNDGIIKMDFPAAGISGSPVYVDTYELIGDLEITKVGEYVLPEGKSFDNYDVIFVCLDGLFASRRIRTWAGILNTEKLESGMSNECFATYYATSTDNAKINFTEQTTKINVITYNDPRSDRKLHLVFYGIKYAKPENTVQVQHDSATNNKSQVILSCKLPSTRQSSTYIVPDSLIPDDKEIVKYDFVIKSDSGDVVCNGFANGNVQISCYYDHTQGFVIYRGDQLDFVDAKIFVTLQTK